MKELTLVTAFWDVGRGDSSVGYSIPRTNQRYYDEFSVWARMKNHLIIYTDSKTAKIVKEIRSGFGLSDRTTIHVIENVFAIEPELFLRMEKVEQNKGFHNFRYLKNAMSNVAKFDYAWLMKYWCLMKAAEDEEENTLFAWLDFGFNHIDVCYTKPEEFEFVWKCNLSEEKIHVFSKMPTDSFVAVDSLQYLFDCMLGVVSIVPQRLCVPFWKLMKKAMEALLMIDCIDDDQQLLLMATRECPELFEIHQSNWFMPLKEHGGAHLTIRKKNTNENKVNIFRLLKRKIATLFKRFKSKKEYSEYAHRIYLTVKHYYSS